ncbi:hypothetical protein GIB67_006093, partial [Kingdonia uniflora]
NVTISHILPGNNPGDTKASPDPEFVLREDWVKFVDYCNSGKFLVYVYVIRTYPCAEERGILDEEISRVEVYIPAHTKKDKTIQCPDVIAELENTMRKDPKSIQMGPNDAITQVFNVIELIIEMYYYLSIYSYIKIWSHCK